MRDPRLTAFAKANRKEMSEPAMRMWLQLRAERFLGIKFRREKVIGNYIADFAANDPKLVIEVDGETHDIDDPRDALRTRFLESQGYRVQRYSNLDVMQNIEGVLMHLTTVIDEMRSPLPTLSPEGERGMTNRLASAFAKGRPALVTFVTGGDGPTGAILDALVAGGADVIELGMPFTDPMADGPAIQQANLRSLGAGTTTADLFALAAGFRARHPNTPLVLMGYANPMTTRGPEWFAAECAKAGVDGVICVDIPPEEDPELGPALRAAGVALIRLATPTTDAARLPTVLEGSSGFLYYVSVAGITGMQQAAQASIEQAVARLTAASDIPIAVGFGVRTPEQAAAIARVADGVVVGSALVELVGQHGADAAGPVRELTRTLADAVHGARVRA
jgi:tryptophan synthase alpha chain